MQLLQNNNSREYNEGNHNRELLSFKRQWGSTKHSFLIIGAGWAGKSIAEVLIKKWPDALIGFLDDNPLLGEECVININSKNITFPILGSSYNLIDLAKEIKIKKVIIAVTHDRHDHLLDQIIQCQENDVEVLEMLDFYSDLTKKIPIHHSSKHWLVPNLAKPKNDFYHYYFIFWNYLFTTIVLVSLLLPLGSVLALLIKLTSKGNVFYKQKRVGLNGKEFILYKFRTMVKDASKLGEAWTLKNDNRITPVGRWLRKYRLDELPQLINILKGEMSLIGPRPEAVELVAKFKKEIPFYEYRYLVKPGISGWAQVNFENTCSVEGAFEKLQYDLYWIKNKNIFLDLLIFFKSIKVIVTRFGAV